MDDTHWNIYTRSFIKLPCPPLSHAELLSVVSAVISFQSWLITLASWLVMMRSPRNRNRNRNLDSGVISQPRPEAKEIQNDRAIEVAKLTLLQTYIYKYQLFTSLLYPGHHHHPQHSFSQSPSEQLQDPGPTAAREALNMMDQLKVPPA